MKLLFDENLSPRLMESLADVYPGSEHIHSVGLGSAQDFAVWLYAKAHGFAIVSKDSDFAERSVLETDPPKIIWIRLGNCSTDEVEATLRSARAMIETFFQDHREVCLMLTRSDLRG